MRHLITISVALATAWTAAEAKVREVRRLQPSSKWVVEYADESCSLGRSFGDGDRKVTMFLEQFVPGDTFTMMFVGESIKPRALVSEATIRFGPNEEKSESAFVAATVAKETPAIIIQSGQRLAPLTEAEKSAHEKARERDLPYDPQPLGAAREKAATWVELGRALPFDLVLDTGPMDEPLEALRRCAWDTVRTWGLDVEQQKALTRKAYPTRPSHTWFSHDDYPREMQALGYEAIVHFRVIVDETGRAASCRIQSSTRPKEFDDVVCKIVMKRARFHPALDAQGKPVRSYWRQTVNFRLVS